MVNEVKNNDMSKINASAIALVDFNATWCGPCRMLAPVLEKVSDEFDGKVDFFGVDVDENGSIAQQFGIMSIPTIIIFKNGTPVDKTVGFLPDVALRQFIEKNL